MYIDRIENLGLWAEVGIHPILMSRGDTSVAGRNTEMNPKCENEDDCQDEVDQEQ